MDITDLVTQEPTHKKELPDFSNLVFGKHYTDRMLTIKYSADKGWYDAKIEEFANFSFSPAMTSLHYSQEIFEGMKAYFREDGHIGLFRPKENFLRMNSSAKRMCMPELDVDFCLKALYKLIKLEKKWIPGLDNSSLYIRPTMIGTDAMIGHKASQDYLFYIILSPVGAYYQTKGGLRIIAEDKYVRAVAGGTGEAKTGGNYAASLLANIEAQQKGYSQVLWLDGVHRKFAEEVGTMNIFFVYKDKLKTPALNGSILPGITRKSVIALAQHLGIEVEECALDINEIVADIDAGKITECFGSGTAVVITPVSVIGYKGNDHNLDSKLSLGLTGKIYKELTDLQYGKTADPFGWTVVL